METNISPHELTPDIAQMEQVPPTRREFLQAGLLSALGLGLLSSTAEAAVPELTRQKISYLDAIADVGSLAAKRSHQRVHTPGKVVEAHHPSVFPSARYPVKTNKAYQMVSAVVMGLTGQKTPKAAWSQFAAPGDRVGILVDPLGSALMRTRRDVIGGVTAGLQLAGVSPNDIIVWCPRGEHLKFVGFNINWGKRGIQAIGANQLKFDRRFSYRMRSGLFGASAQITELVTRHCTKIINIATLETDGIIGCRLSLAQQVLSSFSNSSGFAKVWGGPAIGKVASTPLLRQRFQLHLIDGLAAAYNGAAGYWHPQAILGSTDPVALDRIAFAKIDAHRRRMGLSQITNSRNNPTHINVAATNGVGIANVLQIKHQRLVLN